MKNKIVYILIIIKLIPTAAFAQISDNEKKFVPYYTYLTDIQYAIKEGNYQKAVDLAEVAISGSKNEKLKLKLKKLKAKANYYKNLENQFNQFYANNQLFKAYLILKFLSVVSPEDEEITTQFKLLSLKLQKKLYYTMQWFKGDTVEIGTDTNSILYQDATPKHYVVLTDFYLDRYEVTNWEFAIFLNYKLITDTNFNPYLYIDLNKQLFNYISQDKKTKFFIVKKGYENYPVVNVTWLGALEFCKWVNKTLPTEAQWEYAAKTGLKGKKLEDIAYFAENSNGSIHPVGSKQPDANNIYDLFGNVREWVYDYYFENFYILVPEYEVNPYPLSDNITNSVRGGCYSSSKEDLKPFARDSEPGKFGYPNLGFRCAICPKCNW